MVELVRLDADRAGNGQWIPLLGWVRDIGAEPGRQLREVYLSFAAQDDLELRADYLTDSPARFVTELQVPVLGLPGGAT